MPDFIHLHVHSSYSPMQGVATLEELCAAARAAGADTLALTDTNGLYGAVRFIGVARQAGLRPILGAEVVHQGHRCVLLVKTQAGYGNVCRVLSHRHGDPAFDLIEQVVRHRDGLIVLSDDEEALAVWQKTSRDDLYVELTPGPQLSGALAFARRAGLPPVATTRAHFLSPGDFTLHRLLRAIALNTTLSRLPADACCAPTHRLMPRSEISRHFPHVPEAIAHTARIARACYTDWDFKENIFPAFRVEGVPADAPPTPTRVGEGRDLTDDEAFALLREKTYEGARDRYGHVTSAVKDRIEEELAVIRAKRYASYFLVVHDIVRQAPQTCGRGSVAASIVSYCLKMTHVEPLAHHLFFQRFLSPGRQDPPDIDIDFPWDKRDEVIQQVLDGYRNRAAMVANQNGLELRGAFRETAKVYGMPAADIARLSPLIQRQKDFLWFASPPTPREWAAHLSRTLRLQTPWPEILDLAVRLVGHFRHLSVHCGGVVIVPDEIDRYVPVEIAAKGVPVIQWDKDQTEDAGLVKIDLLGNRSLAVIRDALEAIESNTGRRIEYASWDPIEDQDTRELIRRADTIGCFYIESPATRLLLRKLWSGMPADRRAQEDVFHHLVIVSSLVRPAGNPFIQEYVRRAHGGRWQPLHPIMTDVLGETYEIMVYQEDVTKIAMALAGFSVDDAEQLRKVLSKKHRERRLRDYRAQFYRGALERGATAPAVNELWAMIMSFAGYSFCKPHSASYAQVSFKCAYLRAHYPAEFMAAVISNEGGFYSTFAYVSEARRMGLTVLPPDINASAWPYTGAGRAMRMGLMQIKTLPKAVADRIIENRIAHGPFRSFQDFLARVRPQPAQARALIQAGCCDSIAGELTRPAMLWRAQVHGEAGPIPIPEEYTDARKLEHEVKTLGFLHSRHPLDLYRDRLHGLTCTQARDLHRHVGRQVTLLGWLLTEKSVETKHEEPMEFATFEDTSGLYDATIFPDTYRRVCHLLTPDRPYLVRGIVEQNFGVVTLTVKALERLDARRVRTMRTRLPIGYAELWSASGD